MYQYQKPFLSVSQLIKKLEDEGMTIDSKSDAESALTSIGYYRLKGYCFHNFDINTQKYISGTNLSDVLKLYYFDNELSHLLFGFLSQIEVALRARLIEAFQSSQDPLVLNDPSFFSNKKDYWKNQRAIAAEISRSNDVFIKHNFDKHEGAIPIWASTEVMSFGTLSKVIKTMKKNQKSAFSKLVQHYKYKTENGNIASPSQKMFTSWLQAVSVIRNICAHNSRIYNRTIATTPQLIKVDINFPRPKFNGLYQIMLSMKYLRPNDKVWNTFVADFEQLLSKYSEICDVSRMNFPLDWSIHFQL